jgi:hypothetical protein
LPGLGVARGIKYGLAPVMYPSGVGRLLRKGEINDASVFDWGVVRESVHKFDYGHKFAGATATPVMA